MGGLVVFGIVLGAAIFFLKGFDRVSGRGPKQVRDGIKAARAPTSHRVACPHCAEMIMPAAKICPFCKSSLQDKGA